MPEGEDSTLQNELNTVDTLNNTMNSETLLENSVTDANMVNESGNIDGNTTVINENSTVVDENINTENNEGETSAQTGEVQDNAVALGTGGGEVENVNSDDEQMKKDAESIKNNYEITLPLRGTITSRFGDRDIEPQFHTGIDVARDTGSEIISATNGTVILAEEQSSYGKVLKIQNNDLILLYAHCDELLVNVGDQITMMQPIAKVGSTGNSTGPHLHFEIRYQERKIDPQSILEL